jgi:Predicted transcriptional regulator, contains C-terminal CBS domains
VGLWTLTEDDVLDAMRSMQGYVDITPGTFREIYSLAYDLAQKRIRTRGKAEEIMSSPVHCLHCEMSVSEAAKFMADLGISGAPVVDVQGMICGVVSEKDFSPEMGGCPGTASFMTVIAECLTVSGCLVADLRTLHVHELMSRPPVVASPGYDRGGNFGTFHEAFHQPNSDL